MVGVVFGASQATSFGGYTSVVARVKILVEEWLGLRGVKKKILYLLDKLRKGHGLVCTGWPSS